jgi:DNA-binding MarR family transcriptional regulator
LKLAEEFAERLLSRMTSDERRELVLSVVERMLSQMTAPERQALMERVVDRFLDGLPDEERQATVRELVPRLLGQLMQSGNMNVDELLWAAMGSLGALEKNETESKQ